MTLSSAIALGVIFIIGAILGLCFMVKPIGNETSKSFLLILGFCLLSGCLIGFFATFIAFLW